MEFSPKEREEYVRLLAEEADAQLRAIGEGLLALRRNPGQPDLAHEPHRAAHTLKGSAGYLGLEGIQVLAQALEAVLKAVAEGRMPFGKELEAALVPALDLLHRLVRRVASGGTDDDPQAATLAARLRDLLSQG